MFAYERLLRIARDQVYRTADKVAQVLFYSQKPKKTDFHFGKKVHPEIDIAIGVEVIPGEGAEYSYAGYAVETAQLHHAI